MLRFLVFALLALVHESKARCDVQDAKNLLQGCEVLSGLTVSSVGGTVVGDKNCGFVLPKQDFADEPVFRWEYAEAGSFYTIVMVDPDAPGHREGQFFLHMIKTNVPGTALKSAGLGKTEGDDNIIYRKPGPPRNTGAHRYISIVYRQELGKGFSPSLPRVRPRFSLDDWIHGKELCGPLAATQFKAIF